jgi:hypothetical protein
MENRKDLIKKFRGFVSGGQHASRSILLGYAFLREVPYVALERKINEDHPTFDAGRNGILIDLAHSVARKITEAQFGKGIWELRDNKEAQQQFHDTEKSIKNEVCAWIREKYTATTTTEVAA